MISSDDEIEMLPGPSTRTQQAKRKSLTSNSAGSRKAKKARLSNEPQRSTQAQPEVLEISDDSDEHDIIMEVERAIPIGGLLTPRSTPTPAPVFSAPEPPPSPELHAWDTHENLYEPIPRPREIVEELLVPAMDQHLSISPQRTNIRFSLEPRLQDTLRYVYRSPRYITKSFPKLRRLKMKAGYSLLTGVVNEVIQRDGVIIVASSTTDGGPEELGEDPAPGPYNESGTLTIIDRTGRAHDIALHHSPIPNTSNFKTYDVHDITVAPHDPRLLVSSGSDRRIWAYGFDFVDEASGDDLDLSSSSADQRECTGVITHRYQPTPENTRVLSYRTLPCVPHELLYKPDGYEPILAVACSDSKVRVYQDLENGSVDPKTYPIGSDDTGRSPAVVWGRGPTSGLIYAATLADSYGKSHKCIDPEYYTGRARMIFNIPEDNDNIALDPHGITLAAMTMSESRNTLWLLDIARKHKSPIQHVELEPFTVTHRYPNGDLAMNEVKSAEYSPDGILLALGRTDNSIHVYDTRMIGKGPLHQFSQPASRRSVGRQTSGEVFGVAKLHWVEGEKYRYGLISSGTDAQVRLWDVQVSSEEPLNGHVLAEADFDVSTFNVAKSGQDHSLILGDAGGSVRIFDRW